MKQCGLGIYYGLVAFQSTYFFMGICLERASIVSWFYSDSEGSLHFKLFGFATGWSFASRNHWTCMKVYMYDVKLQFWLFSNNRIIPAWTTLLNCKRPNKINCGFPVSDHPYFLAVNPKCNFCNYIGPWQVDEYFFELCSSWILSCNPLTPSCGCVYSYRTLVYVKISVSQHILDSE